MGLDAARGARSEARAPTSSSSRNGIACTTSRRCARPSRWWCCTCSTASRCCRTSAGATTLLDVGTGAGLPGIPLAIARPDLRGDAARLEPQEVRLPAAGEDRARAGQRRGRLRARGAAGSPTATFDVVVSRAFSDLADFVAQARHLVAPGGRLLAMKGVLSVRRDRARSRDASRRRRWSSSTVPTLDAKRHLVLLEAA